MMLDVSEKATDMIKELLSQPENVSPILIHQMAHPSGNARLRCHPIQLWKTLYARVIQ
jgi:hypothetical protein